MLLPTVSSHDRSEIYIEEGRKDAFNNTQSEPESKNFPRLHTLLKPLLRSSASPLRPLKSLNKRDGEGRRVIISLKDILSLWCVDI